jgi:hypothetical protein
MRRANNTPACGWMCTVKQPAFLPGCAGRPANGECRPAAPHRQDNPHQSQTSFRSLRKVFIPLVSGRPLCRQAELDHFPPLLWRNPLCTFREVGRYVKLNYFCHGSVPQVDCSFLACALPPISMAQPLPPALTARGIAQSEFFQQCLAHRA